MLLLTSLTSLLAAGGGLFVMGPSLSPLIFETLAVVGTLSAFVAICSTEATLSS